MMKHHKSVENLNKKDIKRRLTWETVMMSKTFKYSRKLNFTIRQPDYVLLQSGVKLSIRFIWFIVSKVCWRLAAGRRSNEGFSGNSAGFRERERRCSESMCYNDTCACFALRLTPQAPERLKPGRNLKSGQEPNRPGRGEKENSPHTRSELFGFQKSLFITGTFHRGSLVLIVYMLHLQAALYT